LKGSNAFQHKSKNNSKQHYFQQVLSANFLLECELSTADKPGNLTLAYPAGVFDQHRFPFMAFRKVDFSQV